MSFSDLLDWLYSRDGRSVALTVTGAGAAVEVRATGRLGAVRPPHAGEIHIFVLTVGDTAITLAAGGFRGAKLLRGGSVEARIGGLTLHLTERD